MVPENSLSPLSLRLMAILLGIAVPSVMFGRAVLAVVLILALICMLMSPDRASYWQALKEKAKEPIGLLIIATFLLWMPNVFVSIDPLRSFEAAARILLLLSIMTLFWAALKSRNSLPALCGKALLITSLITVIIALISLTIAPELISFVKANGWQENIRARFVLKPYAAVSALMIPVVFLFSYRLKGSWLPLGLMVIAGYLIIIYGTLNRAALAGILAMCIVGSTLFVISRERNKLALISFITMLVLIISVITWLKVTQGYEDDSRPWADLLFPAWLVDYPRQMMWKFSLGVASDSPWIGMGINTINFVPGAGLTIPDGGTQWISGHPHNWMVEIYAETGLIGLLPTMSLVVMMGWMLAKRFLTMPGLHTLSALLVITGYWSSGLFNFSFWSVWWQASFLLLTLICLSFQTNGEEPRSCYDQICR